MHGENLKLLPIGNCLALPERHFARETQHTNE